MHKISPSLRAPQGQSNPGSSLNCFVGVPPRHDGEILLGLERITAVASKFIPLSFECPIVTVAGTNGKGTTVAVLSALARAAGFRVATYTSPHLYKFNERIQINNQQITDEKIDEISAQIEAVRGETELTYFEHTTLMALKYFHDEKPDLIILEVGLGGRLDATNMIDPDIAIITSIGIDHTAYLGETKEQIAIEKAGIMRAGKPIICGELALQAFLKEKAEAIGAVFYGLGQDFFCLDEIDSTLVPSNIACAVKAAELIGQMAGVPAGFAPTKEVIEAVQIPGRKQHLEIQGKSVILDVAHNEDSIRELVHHLALLHPAQIHLVMGVMGDKVFGSALNDLVDRCKSIHLAAPNIPRAMPADQLMDLIDAESQIYPTVSAAFASALAHCQKDDFVLVTGSFYTINEMMITMSSS